MLCAELYEQTGNTDSCLAYISEAIAIGRCSSQAVRSIVSLLSMRIWERLKSARYRTILNRTLHVWFLQSGSEMISSKFRGFGVKLWGPGFLRNCPPPPSHQISVPLLSYTYVLLSSLYLGFLSTIVLEKFLTRYYIYGIIILWCTER